MAAGLGILERLGGFRRHVVFIVLGEHLVCPKHAIHEHARTRYPVVNQALCIACFCCMESCPHGAIALQLRLGARLPLAERAHREATAG